MKIILMIMFSMSILNAEFIKIGNIVQDNVSGLEWQDESSIYLKNWKNAISYCTDLSLNGSGWRLPNINELRSISNRRLKPAIVQGFKNVKGDFYWSSTAWKGLVTDAWGIDFEYGEDRTLYKYVDTKRYVRCVRDMNK